MKDFRISCSIGIGVMSSLSLYILFPDYRNPHHVQDVSMSTLLDVKILDVSCVFLNEGFSRLNLVTHKEFEGLA